MFVSFLRSLVLNQRRSYEHSAPNGAIVFGYATVTSSYPESSLALPPA